MRLSPCVPRRVPPARAVGAVCAVPLLRGRTSSFSLLALLRAVEQILACPGRFRVPAARPGNRLYTAGPGPDTQSLGYPPTDQPESRVAPGQPALMTLDSLFAFARPAPMRVACLSFGFVDTDLPDTLGRRCRHLPRPLSSPRAAGVRLRK